MTYRNRVNEEYLEWLFQLIGARRFDHSVSYRKLLTHLHNIEFTWFIPHDDNRADDGISLRYKYGLYVDNPSIANYLTGPCSVLEMMVALAVRWEESTMDDDRLGDRTGQWFWSMIHSLGLSGMRGDNFNVEYVDDVIGRFLARDYAPDGRGGLFTIKNPPDDMRKVEIWCQFSWYLGSIM